MSELETILKKDGAVLVRSKKHLVYKLSNGKTFIGNHTPSDVNAEKIQVRELRRLLGGVPEHKEGVRREKKLKSATKAKTIIPALVAPPLKDFRASLAALRPQIVLARLPWYKKFWLKVVKVFKSIRKTDKE